jgi:excisionase family DNA binding protein
MSKAEIVNRPELPEPKLLWNLKETCAQLGLSRSTVLSLCYSGKLPSVTIGRRRMFPSNKVRYWAASLPGAPPLTWEELSEKDDLEMRQLFSNQP